MSIFIETFMDQTVGAAPTRWTVRRGNPTTLQVVADSDAPYGKALRIQGDFFSGGTFVSFDPAGEATEAEILLLFKAVTGTASGCSFTYAAGAGLRKPAQSGDAYTVLLDTYCSLGGETQRPSLGITYGDLSSESVLAFQDLASLGGPVLALRARISGNTMQAKLWTYGQEEPPGWQVTANHSALQKGYVGFSVPSYVEIGTSSRYLNYDVQILYAAVGTAGDPAPMPPELLDLHGEAGLALDAGGTMGVRHVLAGAAPAALDGRGVLAARLALGGTAGMAVDLDGRFFVDVLGGTAPVQVDARASLAGRWELSGQAKAQVSGAGRIVARKAVSGILPFGIDLGGNLRGAHVPMDAVAAVALDMTGVLPARTVIRGRPATLELPAFGDLTLYRFVSPYPPQIFVIERRAININPPVSSEKVVAVLGMAPRACNYSEAVHTEQLFGPAGVEGQQVQHTLTLTVPGDHEDAQYLKVGNLLVFRDLDGNFQAFEISRTEEKHEAALQVTVFCHHVFVELRDEWIHGKTTLTNVTAQQALQAILAGTLWEPGIVEDLGLHQITFGMENVLQALTHFVAVFNAELAFRVEFEGHSISRRYVDAFVQRGARRGKRFEWRKDLHGITRTVDDSELKTALYGYGKEDDAGNRVTFENVEWDSWWDPADKPKGQRWVGDPEALARWGRGSRHRFGVFEDNEETDPERLLQKTWEHLQKIKEPRISYDMDVMELERLAGYRQEAVRIGDTVAVVDHEFQPPLRIEARVVQIERDLVDPENTRVVIGNYLPSLFPALEG